MAKVGVSFRSSPQDFSMHAELRTTAQDAGALDYSNMEMSEKEEEPFKKDE